MLDIEQYIGCIPYILNKYHLPDEEFYDIAMYGLFEPLMAKATRFLGTPFS